MLIVLILSSSEPLQDQFKLSAVSLVSLPLSVCRSSLKISLTFFLQMVSRPQNLANPGPPVYAKPRRLDPEKLSAAKEEFSTMEKAGII